MIRKQWQKVKEIFSSNKTRPANYKIVSIGNKSVIDEVPTKKEQTSFKFENNIKTLQQDRVLQAHNSLKDNFPDSFLSQDIDSYKLLKKIGSGGMGDVYVAKDAELHRKVAIKLLPQEFTKNKERVQRFRQEAQAASKLNHPNIITIHKIGRTKEIHYMVTEFVDGFTLRELINQGMNIIQVLEIIIQVTSALKSTHEAGIIHRDIKPENIMIRNDGLVKVLDFGLAKLIEPGNSDSLEITSFHTQAGQIIGTPNYMSPEQVEGDHIDARTDLFSLGSLLYECLTGKQAFDGASAPKILTQIVKFVPPFPSKFNSQIVPELDKVTLKLLKKNPSERFQTADEVISRLNEIKIKLQSLELLPVKNAGWRANTSKLKFLYPLPSFTNKLHAAFLLIPLIIILGVFAYFQMRPTTSSSRNADALKLSANGTEALRDGTYFKASKMFEDAIKFDPSFVLAHARLAEAWMELDYVGRAQNELLKVRNLQQKQTSLFNFSPTEDSLYVDAVNATVLRDFPKAISIYENIAQISPNESYAFVDLGRAFEKNEEIEKAIENYEKAASLNPQNGGALLRLGTLLNRKSEFPKAFDAFDRAENIYDRQSNDEGVAEVRMQRGASLNSQEKLDAARTQFEQVINAPRTSKYQQIRAMLQISSVCASEAKTTCAQDYASRAIELAKVERMENLATNGLIDLGNAFLVRAEYEKAEQSFTQALEFARKDEGSRNEARALLSLASLRIEQDKPDEAQNYVKQALPFYQKGGYEKQVSQANLILGRANLMTNDYDAALQAFEQVEHSEDASDKASAQISIGTVLMRQEKYPEALRRFEQSYKLYESIGTRSYIAYSLQNLGDVQCQLGRFKDAKKNIIKAEAIANEKDSSLSELLGYIQLANAQIALSEQNFTQAIKYSEQISSKTDPALAFESYRVIGLAQSKLNAKSSEGIQNCIKALKYATSTKDPRTINIAKLALAEAYLNMGNYSDALETALQAKDFFVTAKQQESGWRAWLMAARASQQNGDQVNTRKYASKALEILSTLQIDWGDEYFKIYLAKPNVNLYFSQAEELAQS
jgi:serine/threonine protein kinase/cytochrome c-type biogenesis protein CcmH/NrfG